MVCVWLRSRTRCKRYVYLTFPEFDAVLNDEDIAFSGSHAIWAQHTSGAFTQFDLHDTTKPLDSIPRAALSWEATGSMSLVVDKMDPLEIPYDDA